MSRDAREGAGGVSSPLVIAVTVAALLAVATAALAIWTTRAPSAAEVTAAERLAAAESRTPILEAAARDCRGAPAAYGLRDAPPTGPAHLPERCEAAVLPRREAYLGRPALSAQGVREGDAVLLGLVVTALAGLGGAMLAAGQLRRGAAAGALLGVLSAAGLWAAVAAALVVRDLPPPGLAAVLQTLRIGVLAAVVAVAAQVAAGRLGAPLTVIAASVAAGASLTLPLSVLDLVAGWVQGRS